MGSLQELADRVTAKFPEVALSYEIQRGELTLEVLPSDLLLVCNALKNDAEFKFEQLIDVCGVDYLQYGVAEWKTDDATATGFERGANRAEGERVLPWDKPRFAVVYHLLSVSLNKRIRLKAFLSEEPPRLPSVVDIWPAANWFEREAFDLYGILFEGHPDLRRILTDYGFIGHPFRKDFPISGHVEMRYDAKSERVIYQPVSIKPRILVPKVIREDSRYASQAREGSEE